MDEASTSIGAQLRRLRREKALTQEELAERAGVSKDLIAKLEQGSRQSARLASLTALANALDVSLSELTGARPSLDGGQDGASVLALRNALLTPDVLPGFEPGEDSDPKPLAEVGATVKAANRTYWKGGFAPLMAHLPPLIGEARLAAAAGGPGAAGPLAQAYELAACLMLHVGKDDLAAIAAERAIATAHAGGDELRWANLHGTYSWVLLRQARPEEAERLAVTVADRIEPGFSGPEPRLAVWGNLLMSALAPAAAAGKDVAEYISLASAAAERIGRRLEIYHTSFGPATVAMQAAHAYAVTCEPARALESAHRIRPGDLTGISRGRHLLDVAQAHLDARHHRAATAALGEALATAPVWWRHQAIARSLVHDLVQRERRLSPALRRLARQAGVN